MFMENQFPYLEVRRVLYSRLKVSNYILAACYYRRTFITKFLFCVYFKKGTQMESHST